MYYTYFRAPPGLLDIGMAYPGNTARAVFRFQLPNGTNGYVTPHVRTDAGLDYSQAELDGLVVQLGDWATANNFQGATNTSLMGLLVDDIILQDITLTTLTPGGALQAVEAVNQAGSIAQLPLPNEAALVTTWRTALVGRSFRGRSFWPGLAVTQMEANGTLNNGSTATFQTTFNALVDGIKSGTNSVMAVHSPTLLQANEVTSVTVRDIVHHQSRRNS